MLYSGQIWRAFNLVNWLQKKLAILNMATVRTITLRLRCTAIIVGSDYWKNSSIRQITKFSCYMVLQLLDLSIP